MFSWIVIAVLLVWIAWLHLQRYKYLQVRSGETEESRTITIAKSNALKDFIQFLRSDPNVEEQIKNRLEADGGKELLLDFIQKAREWVEKHGYDKDCEYEIIGYFEDWLLDIS